MNLPQITDKMTFPDVVKAVIECFRQIGAADNLNRKTNADVVLGSGQRLLMLGDDGLKYSVTIVGGVLTVTPL